MTEANLSIEQWGMFELALNGPAEGNPFQEVRFSAHFSYKHRTIEVDGFYDGDGVYRVRFMPDVQGEWRYRTQSNVAGLDGKEGRFLCVAPRPGNHGPVRVAHTYHFAYADGTPYKQIGTTCYVWNLQGATLEAQTLATLAQSPFNKIRFCVFPKHYRYNENEPERYPFPCLSKGDSRWMGSHAVDVREGWRFDFERFDPAYFQHLDRCVARLCELGVEADIILFHPYDRWGFATMTPEQDERYLRYVVARLAAYRNVWWSMANEYDLMTSKSMADWDRFFRIVQESDPYQHLRSIHNCHDFYDHSKPWVTHQSIQHSDLARVGLWRSQVRKPVVVDECCYEGNIPMTWGNISAREMVHRFWLGTAHGGYVGHGETYLHPQDILWWSKGGVLHGESPPRLAFLRRLLEEGPTTGLDPVEGVVRGLPCAGKPHEFYLIYTGVAQPALLEISLPAEERYRAEVIDVWNMTVTPGAIYSGRVDIPMPGKDYQALVLRRVME
ncbi:DUF5060 domain-containing protein [Caldilinea sp.]|uniref:DUF5060 domain-containing protein n=1 Tax=Caldilinea sp. TaxID=2293560 RepID=UPI0021DC2688|nr:DUF5060 domain-containing protein [Caldilinea sp.]GIV70238.1 MAG: hypothetical protein KatS3mg048_3100 [Caldilinea sp.]